MLVLGLDTSGLQLGVCLLRGTQRLASETYEERREQGEVLLPLIDRCLAAGQVRPADLQGIAVVTGPGSFTGLRLGLAAAQGLARVLGCRTAGYDRFTLLRAALGGRPAAIVLDSLRAELFVQTGDELPQMLTPEQIAAVWSGDLAGDGAAHVPGRTLVQLSSGAELAARRLQADVAAGVPLPPLHPFYLRAPDVTGVPA